MKVLGNESRKSWPQQWVSDLRKRIAENQSAPAMLRANGAVVLIVADPSSRALRDGDRLWREIVRGLSQHNAVVIVLLDGQPLLAEVRDLRPREALENAEVYVMRLTDGIDPPSALDLVRFDEPDDETQIVQPVGQAALLDAVTLLEAREFDKAIRLLQKLRDGGYKPQFFSIDTIITQAREQRQQAARSAYAEIAALATSRVTWPNAREAWIAFLAKYPDFGEDRANLADKLKYQAPSTNVEPGERAHVASPDPLHGMAEIAKPLADQDNATLSLPRFGDEDTLDDSLRWLADLVTPLDESEAAR